MGRTSGNRAGAVSGPVTCAWAYSSSAGSLRSCVLRLPSSIRVRLEEATQTRGLWIGGGGVLHAEGLDVLLMS